MKTLILSTSILTILAAPALAQQAPSADELGQRMIELMNEYGFGQSSSSFTLEQGLTVGGDAFIATSLLGAPVRTAAAADAEVIGDINNLVLSETGQIAAVVIGVGGFLGMGEKEVAVPFADLDYWFDENGQRQFVLPTTREALDAAPAFVWEEPATASVDQPVTLPAPAGDPMAPPADQMAETPLDNPGLMPDEITPDSLQAVDVAALTAEELIGAEVEGPNSEDIGVVGDVLLTAEGQVDAVIVDVGGFLGVGAKPIAVAFDSLDIRASEAGDLYVWIEASREQLETLPAYDPDLFATNRDAMILG